MLAARDEDDEALRMLKPAHVWRVPEADAWDEIIARLVGSADWRSRVLLRANVWGGVLSNTTAAATSADATIPSILEGSGALLWAFRALLLVYLDGVRHLGYRYVVLTRSDHLYACAHPPVHRLPPRTVLVPKGEGYGGANGVTDRHTVFHFSERHEVLSVLRWLADGHDRAEYVAPEMVLSSYFAQKGLHVKVQRRVMFVVKREGRGVDVSRWAPGVENAPSCAEGLVLKYPAEFHMMETKGGCSREEVLAACPLYARRAGSNAASPRDNSSL